MTIEDQGERLSEAMVSLKDLRNDKSCRGELPRSTSPVSNAKALYFAWDEIPGRHTCPKCGRRFGGNYKANARHEGERKYVCRNDKRLLVKNIDFEHVFEAYLNCKEAGHDVKLDLHCSECVLKNGSVPSAFRFRAHGSSEYVITVPDMRHIFSSDPYYFQVPPQMSRSPWDYALVASFVKAISDEHGSASMEKRCREWLDTVRDGNLYRGQPWSTIFDAIEKILGIVPE